MNFPFLKEETFGLRTQETFVGHDCEIYLPEYFFDKNENNAIATDLGTRIETIGIFYFKVDGSLYKLDLPLRFQFEFSDVEKRRFKIKPEMHELGFYVYKLKTGNAFVYDVLHKKDTDDMKKVFLNKLIEGAKLPNYVSYNEVLDIFLKAMVTTGCTGLGVSSVSIEFMLSEIYRNKHKLQDPFRLAYNGRNQYDFKMMRLTKIPQLNSTFTGLTGEDITSQLISAVARSRSKEKVAEKETPIEKIIKY